MLLAASLTLLALALVSARGATAQPPVADASQAAPASQTIRPAQSTIMTDTAVRRTVVPTSVQLLGIVSFTQEFSYAETIVGGLSGITYDAANDRYYVLSDDRGQPRFYTMGIDVRDGNLQDGDVTFQNITFLTDENGARFAPQALDPEGIVLTNNGTLFISSEGAAINPPMNPFVNEFTLAGQQTRALPVPPKFVPTGVFTDDNVYTFFSGVRNNLAFESLTISPDWRYLYTATENALAQDGPPATLESGSLSRVIKYDLATGQPVAEMVYPTEKVAQPSTPAGEFTTNGLVELLALDNNGTFLALERSFSVGAGNTVKLYHAFSQGALDVSSENDLFWEAQNQPFEIDPPIAKHLLLDFADLGITPDNLEGMTFGPRLADGRYTLIVVSDDNFNPTQSTQFIALALDLAITPAATPALETVQFIDDASAQYPGDPDDPAIWVHPTDPAQSLVLATVKDGGMYVFDLDGQITQVISPTPFGAFRYNNVDLIYNFALTRTTRVDLAVASDRQNDTVAIFSIDPATRQITDITADTTVRGIFGGEPGEATAYGLATYTNRAGRSFVFVTEADGPNIAQLELVPAADDKVRATRVRMLTLPVAPGDDPEDYQSEGTVVDRELGFLYVAVEDKLGIVRFPANPIDGNKPVIVQSIDADYLHPDIEGLTIYYGRNRSGYLLASSQGNSTYAVFTRGITNTYLGSFVIGDSGPIDQANESDGADVMNVPLGSRFPSGLLVVQDGANDPQVVAEDDEELENRSTNFKFVPWESVANAFPRPLRIDTESYDPRAPRKVAPRGQVRLRLVCTTRVKPGGILRCRLTITNLAGVRLRNVRLVIVLPFRTTFSAANSSDGWQPVTALQQTGAVYALNVGELAADGSGTAEIGVTVDEALTEGATLPFEVQATSDDSEGGAETVVQATSALTTEVSNSPFQVFLPTLLR